MKTWPIWLTTCRVAEMAAPTKRQKATKPKTPAKRGRPTAYKAIYAEQAHAFCLLGADDKKLSELFEVGEATINRWKLAHPEFRESIKRAKEGADCQVAAALFQRAIGFSHPDVHISNYQGGVTVTPITKHYPPDPVSGIFWLKNRQPHLWRDRVEVKADVSIDPFPPKEKLQELFEDSLKRSTEKAKALAGRRERLGIGDGAD